MTCSYKDCDKPVFVAKTSLGGLCNGHYAQLKRGKPLGPLRTYTQRKVDPNYDTCPVPNCGRPSWHKHGYCQSHQHQIWAGETPAEIRPYKLQAGSKCNVPDCDKHAKSRGYCSKHYRNDWGTCTAEGCGRKMHNKSTGLCAKHYTKQRKEKAQV